MFYRCTEKNCKVKDLCRRYTDDNQETSLFRVTPINDDGTCEKFSSHKDIELVAEEAKDDIYERELEILSKSELENILEPLITKYGLVFWHKSKTSSYYFKFRDARLGSIRISNHKARDHMNYTHQFPHNTIEKVVKYIELETERRANAIQYFDKNQFVAYNKDESAEVKYIRFFSESDWRKYIKTRKK